MSFPNVLLVEDDEDYRKVVCRFLGKCGMGIKVVETAEEMYKILHTFLPDILILDINLPGDNGFEALQKIRADYRGAVIVLSTRKGVDDKITGLEVGADYYLPKPVNMRELEAVIRSLSKKIPAPASNNSWVLDADRWELIAPDDVLVELSSFEFDIISSMVSHVGEPVSRECLFKEMGKADPRPEDRSLDMLLSRLRSKFDASNNPLPIKSVRNKGYIFLDPVIIRCNKM